MPNPFDQKRTSIGGGRVHRVLLWDIPEAPPPDSYGQPPQTPTQIVNANASDGAWAAKITQIKGDQTLNAEAQVYATRTYVVEMNWLGSAIPATTGNTYTDPMTGNIVGLIIPRMKLQTVMDGKFLNIQEAENVGQM